MHGLQQALLPLVLAVRKDSLKNESINGASQGDAYRTWVSMGTHWLVWEQYCAVLVGQYLWG